MGHGGCRLSLSASSVKHGMRLEQSRLLSVLASGRPPRSVTSLEFSSPAGCFSARRRVLLSASKDGWPGRPVTPARVDVDHDARIICLVGARKAHQSRRRLRSRPARDPDLCTADVELRASRITGAVQGVVLDPEQVLAIADTFRYREAHARLILARPCHPARADLRRFLIDFEPHGSASVP